MGYGTAVAYWQGAWQARAVSLGSFEVAKELPIRDPLIMASFFSNIGRFFGGGDKPPYDLAEVYIGMRGSVLGLKDEDISELKGKAVWAVLMETGHDGAAVTVVAVAEGTASLYFSNGGGMIGLGEHDNVRTAAFALVKGAELQLEHMKKTGKFPVPMPGETIFYVVTPGGVFTYSAKEDDLGNKRDKLSPLFYEGHELITQMRIANERSQADDRGPAAQ